MNPNEEGQVDQVEAQEEASFEGESIIMDDQELTQAHDRLVEMKRLKQQAKENEKRLINRINLLQKEKEKVMLKIKTIQKKTKDIMKIKQRSEETQQMREERKMNEQEELYQRQLKAKEMKQEHEEKMKIERVAIDPETKETLKVSLLATEASL